jgi:type IV pilus assembly protein PilA
LETGLKKRAWVPWVAIAALVAIVIVVALPQYADYTERAQASEAFSLMSSAKTPLAEFYADKERWPPSLEKIVEHTSGKYTGSLVISKGAGGKGELELTATMKREGVHRRIAGATVLLSTADGGKTWRCRPGTMDVKDVPGSCRN